MKNLKKILALGFALGLGLTLVACSGNGEESSDSAVDSSNNSSESSENTGSLTIKEGMLVMATNATFPPYEMYADGVGVAGTDYEGIDVEIAAALAEKLGLTLVVDDVDFTVALASPGQGMADIVMAGVTVNEERKKNMDFTDTYATGVQVVIVTENSAIETLDDLEGKRIGVQEGTTGYIYASSDPEDGGYGEENVLALTNGALCIQSLLAEKVDCVIIDNEPAKAFVSANFGLKILDTEFAVEEYAIGVAKGNTDLLNALNTALAELKADGTVDEIVARYIKAE